MPVRDLPGYIIFAGALTCLVLLFAARQHPPSRKTILEAWQGREHWERVDNKSLRAPAPEKPKDKKGYEKIYNMIQNVQRDACSQVYVLKGENAKEPDVHICLDTVKHPCVVYSFGIADNWIFDDYMVSRGCDVFSFDPSMSVGKHWRSQHHLFEPIGIGAISGTHQGASTLYGGKTDYKVLTLHDIMKRYNHTHVDMIRMDVESAEWSVLEHWHATKTWPKQLLLEIHMWNTKDEQWHAALLENIPLTTFHQAQNHWNNHRLHKDMTQVYELGFIDPRVVPKTYWQSQHNEVSQRFQGYNVKHSNFQHTKIKINPVNSNLMNTTLTALLDRVVRILDILNIRYTISSGTLLGWWRDQRFIPHDDDIDIRVHPEDWHKLENIYKDATKDGKNWNIHHIQADNQLIEILPVQADERLSMLKERKDIQFRVIGVGYTARNHREKLTEDIHLDLISAESVANGFWKDFRYAFDKELMNTTMNGVDVKVTQYYEKILQKQYGKKWRIPI